MRYEIKDLTYTNRLHALKAFTISSRSEFADMVFVFKCLHSHVKITPEN